MKFHALRCIMTNVCSLSLSPRAVMKSIPKSGCVLLVQGWQLRSHFIPAHQMKRYKKNGSPCKRLFPGYKILLNTMRDSGNVLRDTGFDQNTRWDTGFHCYSASGIRQTWAHDAWLGKKPFSGKQWRKFPRGVTWVNFCWVCAASLSEPLPHHNLFCSHIIDPSLVSLGKK